jgi:hypothetical protein
MTPRQAKHFELTKLRAAAYQALFGTKPAAVFPHHQMQSAPNVDALVDIFVYPLEMEGYGEFVVAITNGMSDLPMIDDGISLRREIIQYLPSCTPGHALRLLEMAWFPLTENMAIDAFQGIEWPRPAVPGTPWKNALFLNPVIDEHRDFRLELEGETMELLWHLPISDTELQLVQNHGIGEFLTRMDARGESFIFDEETRTELG